MDDLRFNLFGSADGLDIDLAVHLDNFPSKVHLGHIMVKEIESYIKEKYYPNETREINATLIKVENGIVVKTLKGTNDETNNSLYYTYDQHPQFFPCFINRPLERDLPAALVRGLRGLLSTFTRKSTIIQRTFTRKGKPKVITIRSVVREALKDGRLGTRLEMLKQLTFIDFSTDHESDRLLEHYKLAAAQFAQKLALINGYELYCKADYAHYFPDLKGMLYRESVDDDALERYRLIYIHHLENYISNLLLVPEENYPIPLYDYTMVLSLCDLI